MIINLFYNIYVELCRKILYMNNISERESYMLKDLLANAFILTAFISIYHQIFRDKNLDCKSSLRSKIVLALMGALMGIILIIYSMRVDNNMLIDFRNIALILTAMYGGLISSFIASFLIGAFRVYCFGLTQYSISALICILLTGIGCGMIYYIKISKKKFFIYSVVYSLLITTISFFIVIKNKIILINITATYTIAMVLLSIAIYKYTAYLSSLTSIYRRLKEGYSKDFLTGLNNVRCFDDIYNKTLANAREKNEKLSILFIDIDFFKKVNDNYGHSNGDIILKQLGNILLNNSRSFDVVSRNGGEEFSVILLDCDQSDALKIAEKIRISVEAYPFFISDGTKINITVSIGVSTYPDITSDLDKLFEDADSALYIAKRTGRNKVVLADSNIPIFNISKFTKIN